jgi:hypothetical protein
VQIGVGLAILTETKVTDDHHPCLASGYKILASKAASHNQGGIALLWKENCKDYEVESACIVMPNLLTFQLVTGDEQLYCMGVCIPPTDTMGVEDLWAAWEACPAGCTPLVLGDLNNNFSDPGTSGKNILMTSLTTSMLLTHQGGSFIDDHANNQPGHSGLGSTRER